MAEGNLPPNHLLNDPQPTDAAVASAVTPAGKANPQAAKKRRRRWPYALLAIVLLVGLLAVFAPTLAGTGPGRSIIVGQVNQRINGRVDIGELSLGWLSPVRVGGLKVFDKAGSQILEVPRLTTELSLLDAVRGKLHFGKVTVEGLNALVRRDAQGNINFAQLAPTAAPATESVNPQPAVPAQSGTPSRATLPDISGELHLVNCRATFEDQLQGQTFFFPTIAGTVKCLDINSAIENALEIACKVGDAPPGKLTIAGRADVADGHVVDPDKMDVDQKLTVHGVELGSFTFALGKDGPLQKLAGLTSGAVSLQYRGGEGAGVEAEITSTNFAAGGPALKGDTFATQKLSLIVPPTKLSMPAGSADWKAWTLRVGSSGGADEIVLGIDQGSMRLGADAPLRSLANLGANEPPGATGQLRSEIDLDVGALARQMPHVLAVQEGLTLSSGRFTHSADIQLVPDRATIKRLEAHLVNVRGQRGQQRVSLQPIDVVLTASSFGGGWAGPNVRDLNLSLTSGFANALFTGQDLASLSGNAKGDLKRLRDELGQVFDLGELQLAGPFDVQVTSKGNVAANENATLSTTVTVTDLLVGTTKEKPPLRQSRVVLAAGGEVVRRPDGSVEQLRGGNITLSTGDAAQPTVAAQISIPQVAMMPAAPAAQPPASTQPPSGVASATYQVARLAVNLPKAKAEFGQFLTGLEDYAFDRGILNVTGGGTFEQGALSYDGRVAVNDLSLSRGRVEVLQGYNLTTDAGFAYTPQGEGSQLDVTKLSIADNRGMLSLAKAADQPLRVVTTAAGAVQPAGKLDLAVDLKQLSDLQERLAAGAPGVVVTQDGQSTELRSGRLAGTIELAQAAQGEFHIAGNLEGTGLTVAGPRGSALSNERVGIIAQVRARDDFSALGVDRLDVTGNLLTANVSGTTIQLKVGEGATARPATTAEMVQSATVKAQVPDLGKLQALLDALSAPEPATRAQRDTGVPPVRTTWQASELGNRNVVLSNLVSTGGTPVSPFELMLAQVRQAPPPEQIIGRRPSGQSAAPVRKAPPEAAGGETVVPAPPVKLTVGSASLSLTVQRQGERSVINTKVDGKNISLAKGAGSHTLDAVDLKTSLSFIPVAPPTTTTAVPTTQPAPFSQQIRDLQVPTFVAHAAGSTITVVEPVVISDLGALGSLFSAPTDPAARAAANDAATIKTAIKADGDVGQLSGLLVALGMIGSPDGPKQPYTGRYDLEQRLTGGRDGVGAAGKLNLTDFVAAGSSFNEKAIRFANDVTLDSAKDALSLRSITLAMESTKALELKLGGNVLDYSTKRRFDNVAGTIGYDWAKLWEIVKPMLSREQQEDIKLKIAGQAQRQFALGGSYPAVADDGRPLAFNEAIRFLTGHFEGGFQMVEINGLQVQNLELPMTLRDGRLVVAYHDKPEGQNLPPLADCNSGKLNIGGAVVDLTDPTPRLNLAKGTRLLTGATLNPVFSDMFGGMINNPLFVSPSEARGLVDITVVECNRLPLDSLVLKTVRENDGRAEFLFSIKEVFIGNSTLLEGLKLAGQSEFANSLQGEIRESRVIIERGQTRQDVTINTGESDRPFRIHGSTAMETRRLNMTFVIPPQLLRQLGSTGRQAAELLPDGLPIPLGGTTRAPQLDFNRALTSAVKDGFLPGLLRRAGDLTGGNDKDARDGAMRKDDGAAADTRKDGRTTPPPRTEPSTTGDVVKDLFDLVGKQREKQEREKQQERERRRRERERKQNSQAPNPKPQ